MANQIEICNVALSRVGAGSIQALTEATREARACRTHYEMARDATLRDHDWQFARKRVVLALLSEAFDGWTYGYAYPADCIAARSILNEASTDPADAIAYEVGVNAAKSAKVVLTEQEDAILVYTALVTNTSIYDASFVDALAWRLASELAVPLRADTALQDGFMKKYLMQLGSAKETGSNEQHVAPIASSSFSLARA
jgi:hypothetical protein